MGENIENTARIWGQVLPEFGRDQPKFTRQNKTPETLVPDNLKAAVLKADWYDPDLNPKLRSFCEHYGTVLLPTKPRTPRHKGKVKRGVDYVQENALKGKTFGSLQEQNDYLSHWETTVADILHKNRLESTLKQRAGASMPSIEPGGMA